MGAKIKKILLVYFGILISYFLADWALLKVTGIVFTASTIYQGEVLVVEKGIPYQNYWHEEFFLYGIGAGYWHNPFGLAKNSTFSVTPSSLSLVKKVESNLWYSSGILLRRHYYIYKAYTRSVFEYNGGDKRPYMFERYFAVAGERNLFI